MLKSLTSSGDRVAARDAAEIEPRNGSQGKQRELLDVHSPRADHVQRNPGLEGLPGGFGQGNGAAAMAQNLRWPGTFPRRVSRVAPFPGRPGYDRVPGTEAMVALRIAVEQEPDERHADGHHAGRHERGLPAPHQGEPDHQGRCDR